jgi:hypothetical protein
LIYSCAIPSLKINTYFSLTYSLPTIRASLAIARRFLKRVFHGEQACDGPRALPRPDFGFPVFDQVKSAKHLQQLSALEQVIRAEIGLMTQVVNGKSLKYENSARLQRGDYARGEIALEIIKVDYDVEDACRNNETVQVGRDRMNSQLSFARGPDTFFESPQGYVDRHYVEALAGKKDTVSPFASGQVQRDPALGQKPRVRKQKF